MSLLDKFRSRPADGGVLAAGDNGGRSGHVRIVKDGAARVSYVVSSAETAACTCPEFCERDHENE